ncbi:pyrimidine-nucleoside phosphorylase [Ruminiclostridium sufflavum DSM 19573]|uniref:Pyrimidine-nucleoside phosphorylase n=1 Tax=Ruminiclostridium sufflavum DSM 19573 TaxID=1121337 RepID=A0A318XJZ1_9FIRM|nr:pyrimidine-nucleoside phosphorylase [Ruminiclostridium sufflavum]PYG87595.1 pyrimidine-nucleoside phosphorylase [Ruminiclostridium sufflavum DSM 19573]
MRMYDIIEKKRDGFELDSEEIRYFITEYCSGNIPDYQAAALLMAIFLRGMNERETADLTTIMAHSGDMVDLSEIPGIKADKHSTGGVGDKTTLILAPIVAACGIPVAKMSGRGLGHTGGTIDKLEAIPGFNTAISREVFIKNVKETGISIAGQTGNLAPADKKIYALRDVTATVNNISLIASSIMSKKLASGADRIVLDVKTGSGAFMKSLEDSVKLAREMVKIGENTGRRTVAVVTDMDIPLGYAVGNSLEIIEAIEALKNKGPRDLMEVSFELAARLLEICELGTLDECKQMVREAVESGRAILKLEELIERQGGNKRVINDYSLFPQAAYKYDYISQYDGYIASMKTDTIGVASLELGAGRETKESSIDYAAGILFRKKTGDHVEKGDIIASLYTNKQEKISPACALLDKAIHFCESKPEIKPLILAYIDNK